MRTGPLYVPLARLSSVREAIAQQGMLWRLLVTPARRGTMFNSLDGFRNSANVQVVDGDATKEVRAFGKVDLQAADACVSRGKLIQGDFGAVLSKAQGSKG